MSGSAADGLPPA